MADTALSLPAPAKLNLFLHVTGRRPDGYHTLQTVFQLLDYGDTLHFQLDDHLQLDTDLPALAGNDNLILRAARALQQATGCTQGARIRLDKRIPLGGGLGGGSSDAATTLHGLNTLWQTGLNEDQLADLGLPLGADVPLFVRGRSAWAEGVGEQLTPLTLPDAWFTVLTPACAVATAAVFSHSELTRHTSPITMAAFFSGDGHNDCEPVVRKQYPEVDRALRWLQQFGQARMTGTGSSVFVTLPTQAAAKAALAQSHPQGFHGFVASALNCSPLHRQLGLAD